MRYPDTRQDTNVVDELHGHRIADPYRWLEDPDAAETKSWVTAQNVVSEEHLSTLAGRAWFGERMKSIVHRPRNGTPFYQGGHLFVSRNDGTQNQDIWFIADSVDELAAGGRVIIDPNTLASDGTTSVLSMTCSQDGRTVAYAKSEGGSDWLHFELVNAVSGDPVEDVPMVSKFSVPQWLPDNCSYLYASWPGADRTEGTSTGALSGQRLMLHRLGSGDDELILDFEDPQLMSSAEVSEDGTLLVVFIGRGTEHTNRIWVYRIIDTEGRSTLSEPVKLFDAGDAEYEFVRNDGDTLIFQTDLDASRGRVVAVDLAAAERTGEVAPVELVAEGDHALLEVVAAGTGLLVATLVEAQPTISRYALDGSSLGRLDIPTGGLVGLSGKASRTTAFVGMSSVTEQTRVHVVDIETGAVHPLDLTADVSGGYTPPQITLTRRSAPSKDGTLVPYFLITRAGHDLGQPAPTLLYGYGGFKVPVEADYRPGWSAWLEAGGVLVIANLRGGGEYGTEWYEQGKLDNKQNVFDDFVGVAEDLVAHRVTGTDQLAIHGRSNGGLLVGAAMTQRPDLFAAAIPGVGVLDILRFHKFTIGAAWISDYGNPDVAEDFEVELRYSPLHNVRPGISYPPTLVLTGDHDDRVVPLHSHKFTATLQSAQEGDNPVIARIETNAGHGMGKSTAMVASEWADWLAFAAHHTGLEVGRE